MTQAEPKLSRNVLRIRQLNDAFRKTFLGGRLVVTAGIAALPDHIKVELLRQVQQFDQFSPDTNDLFGERDFGAINFEFGGYGEHVFWKIDCYDKELRFGSPDAADPSKTTRVLTIMRASEY